MPSQGTSRARDECIAHDEALEKQSVPGLEVKRKTVIRGSTVVGVILLLCVSG